MLCDALDRFKELLRKCSQHGYELFNKGSITSKTTREANQPFEELTKNNYQTHLIEHLLEGEEAYWRCIEFLTGKDKNIGFHGYIGTWILWIYQIYWRYIDIYKLFKI